MITKHNNNNNNNNNNNDNNNNNVPVVIVVLGSMSQKYYWRANWRNWESQTEKNKLPIVLLGLARILTKVLEVWSVGLRRHWNFDYQELTCVESS